MDTRQCVNETDWLGSTAKTLSDLLGITLEGLVEVFHEELITIKTRCEELSALRNFVEDFHHSGISGSVRGRAGQAVDYFYWERFSFYLEKAEAIDYLVRHATEDAIRFTYAGLPYGREPYFDYIGCSMKQDPAFFQQAFKNLESAVLAYRCGVPIDDIEI